MNVGVCSVQFMRPNNQKNLTEAKQTLVMVHPSSIRLYQHEYPTESVLYSVLYTNFTEKNQCTRYISYQPDCPFPISTLISAPTEAEESNYSFSVHNGNRCQKSDVTFNKFGFQMNQILYDDIAINGLVIRSS